eukprot:14561607-Alexandrium_andersonii.AAC.1
MLQFSVASGRQMIRIVWRLQGRNPGHDDAEALRSDYKRAAGNGRLRRHIGVLLDLDGPGVEGPGIGHRNIDGNVAPTSEQVAHAYCDRQYVAQSAPEPHDV